MRWIETRETRWEKGAENCRVFMCWVCKQRELYSARAPTEIESVTVRE